jgi:site-specific DNA-methyltransferase (adenine-specific)/modification methylase
MTYTLHCGDCLDVLPGLAAGLFGAIVTDPPYGLGDKLNGGSWGNVSAWDFRNDVRWLVDLAPIVAIWGGNYHELPPSRGWLAWHKPDAVPSMANIELAWTNQDMNAAMLSHAIAATNAERAGHPTQKPLRVMLWCLQMLRIPAGATVVDPFMGSGTTGVACRMLGYRFIGIEKDPHYYAIAERRIAQAQPPLFVADAAPHPEPSQAAMFEVSA